MVSRPEARVVVLTGYGNIATAVTAVKLGAIDYLAKPADADAVYGALTGDTDHRNALPDNPMSADRVRWEHIQRVFELCNRNVSEDGAQAQHASPHPAAHSGQTRAEVKSAGFLSLNHRSNFYPNTPSPLRRQGPSLFGYIEGKLDSRLRGNDGIKGVGKE